VRQSRQYLNRNAEMTANGSRAVDLTRPAFNRVKQTWGMANMSRTLTMMLSALAAAPMALALTACGGTAPKTAPAASAAASPPNALASWSAPCRKVATDLQNAGYSYTVSGTTINWSTPASMTYGDMVAIAAGSQAAAGQGDVPEADGLAHLSYVETTMGNTQAASDLGHASTEVFTYLPAAVYSNSLQSKVLAETARTSAVNGWTNTYLLPVLNDCSNGTG
jgi:hypothetical protein